MHEAEPILLKLIRAELTDTDERQKAAQYLMEMNRHVDEAANCLFLVATNAQAPVQARVAAVIALHQHGLIEEAVPGLFSLAQDTDLSRGSSRRGDKAAW